MTFKQLQYKDRFKRVGRNELLKKQEDKRATNEQSFGEVLEWVNIDPDEEVIFLYN